MSFDKTKAMRNAEKFLSQGKIRAAISEYKRIVENDPRDFSTMNTLGDLYTKNNEAAEAVACFKQVAEHYSKQGFAQKAIAIYNKISRLQPNSPDVSAKLAQLYQMKGSFAEARSHYVALAEQYQQKGQKLEALEIWKQVAQLDPSNTEVYLKIADFCLQSDQRDEAAKAYAEAGQRFAGLNQLEAALSAYSKALEILPYELPALNGFVKTQVKLGYSDEAAKKLESILEQQPYNREILYMLVDCYIDANNPAEAEKAVISLVEQEPANYPKFLNLIELYVKNNDLVSAMRILSMSSEHLLVGGKSEEFYKWTTEILARNPEQVDALHLMVRYYSWQRDEIELKNALERLFEAARAQGAVDEERYALSQLVMIVPHETSYAQRLQELIHEFGGEMPEISVHAPLIDESVAEFQLPAAETHSFDEFALVSHADAVPDHGNFEEYVAYESEVGVSATDEAFIYETNGYETSAPAANDVNFAFAPGADLPVEAMDYFQTAGPAEAAASAGEANLPPLSPSDELRLGQEIEGLEFYISQGYHDLADKTLAILEEEFGLRPEFVRLRQQLGPIEPEPAVTETVAQATPAPVETVATDDFTPEPIAAETPAVVNGNGAAVYDFMSDFRSDLGFEENEPVEDEGDYETHYQTAIVYKEMGLMEEAIREFQDAVNLVRADDGTRRFFQCCNLLGLCFMESNMPNLALMWYRRAMETPNLREEEKQALLYEIGIAYEMGGEKPKALEYFEQIYAVDVDYRDVSTRLESLRSNSLALR